MRTKLEVIYLHNTLHIYKVVVLAGASLHLTLHDFHSHANKVLHIEDQRAMSFFRCFWEILTKRLLSRSNI